MSVLEIYGKECHSAVCNKMKLLLRFKVGVFANKQTWGMYTACTAASYGISSKNCNRYCTGLFIINLVTLYIGCVIEGNH